MHTTRRVLQRTRRVAAVAAVALALVACGGDGGDEVDGGDTDAAAGEESVDESDTVDDGGSADGTDADDGGSDDTGSSDDTGAGGGAAPVTTAESGFGTILVTAEGETLYGFTNDEQGVSSACTGDCLAAWPPLLVDGEQVPPGLDEDVFDVITRDDGTVQLTAGGWPLYTYAADQTPGDTTGQGVGDVWWVVAPDGELVTSVAEDAEDAAGAAY